MNSIQNWNKNIERIEEKKTFKSRLDRRVQGKYCVN